MGFAQKQRAIAVGVFLQQQRVLLEEADSRGERFAGDGARLRRVIHAHIVAERNGAVFERPPGQIRVFAEGLIELRVEAVDAIERLAPEPQVRRHEADALEADVRDGTVLVVVRAIGHDTAFDADGARDP